MNRYGDFEAEMDASTKRWNAVASSRCARAAVTNRFNCLITSLQNGSVADVKARESTVYVHHDRPFYPEPPEGQKQAA